MSLEFIWSLFAIKFQKIQVLEAVARRCSVKKAVLKTCAIFTGKHLRWSLFLITLQGLQHKSKETQTQMISCEYCGVLRTAFFIEHFWWHLLNFFTGSQKETVFSINHSVMKTFKCSFPIDFAFNMSIRCSERTPQPETIFYSVYFVAVIIYRYFLFSIYAKTSNIQ